MLLLAHTGIALGAAALTAASPVFRDDKTNTARAVFKMNAAPANALLMSGLVRLSRLVDLRLFMVGSMLPDIIDKPLGLWLLKDTLSTGRAYGHTLLFLILLLLSGLILLAARRSTWLLVLAAGTFMHELLDGMWNTPVTFYWPLYGTAFPGESTGDFLGRMLAELVHVPVVWVGELAGLLILAWVFYLVIANHKLGLLLRTGRLI
jgi:inner membrane protein